MRIEDLIHAIPLHSLPKRILHYVTTLATLEHASGKTRLFDLDEQTKDVFYLIKGQVALNSAEGATNTISAGTPQARFPLNIEQPCTHSAITLNRAVLAKIPHEIMHNVEQLGSNLTASGEGAAELAGDEMKDKHYANLFHKLQDGDFEIPSMPNIAIRISKAVNNPDATSTDIARIIQMDPALAARIIHIVNSPLYASRHRIDNCPDAVTRLGRATTRSLVLSFILKNLFRTKHAVLRGRMSELWAHSRKVAAVCHVLARLGSKLDPDQAMLAGLIHDIGAIPILNAAKDYPSLIENPELLDKTVSRLQARAGALVLQQWNFMDELTDVALQAENWAWDRGNTISYVDLVILGQLHAYIGTPRMQTLPRIDLTPAFHKLGNGKLTPQQSLKIIEKSKADIQAVEQLLDGG
ncbi:MAG: HDOD domain-containing protein [Candidatus Polarisedimenticolaceae bacterium]|nr:HDOD domain-containing protein [Candidatus Polarisedimenticolaceae bacterium]